MGWFTSDKELRQREAQVEAKYTEIKTLLQSQQNELTVRFQDLGNLGASIMTRSDLEALYQEQLKNLALERETLGQAVASYQEAAQRFLEKEKDLTEREKRVVALECDARASFAASLEEQMQPLRNLKGELDGKAQRILAMQEEFNQNFALQDQKLLADFQRLGAALKEKFEGLQGEMLKEKEALAQREDALNKREMALSVREAEVRQGLTGERSRMLEEFGAAKARLAQQEETLKKMAEELSQRRLNLERMENDLACRMEAVQNREAVAEAGFAKEREAMLAQIQEERNESAKGVVELQRQANVQCAAFLQDWQSALSEARNKMLEGLTTDIQERRTALAAESQALLEQKRELMRREQEFVKKEGELEVSKASLEQKERFLQEKERIMEEHFRQIAEERIQASQAEIQALQASKAELTQKFASLQMEVARMRAASSVSGGVGA
ncbi:MAG: hypothetical protein ACI4SG_03025 [Oligosphaeraceae bacterium]